MIIENPLMARRSMWGTSLTWETEAEWLNIVLYKWHELLAGKVPGIESCAAHLMSECLSTNLRENDITQSHVADKS